MEKVLFIVFTALVLVSCTSDSELALKEKELELKERELDIKEREMELAQNSKNQETTENDNSKNSTYSSNQNLSTEKVFSTEKNTHSENNTISEQPSPTEMSFEDTYETEFNSSIRSNDEETVSNPFSGSGNSGDFGNDADMGTGSSHPATDAGDGSRIRVSNLTTNPKTPNDQRCKIALKLTVDSLGKVIEASEIKANTTSTNQRLIDEVISLVKKEVKYKEKPGSRNETAYYTITVNPG